LSYAMNDIALSLLRYDTIAARMTSPTAIDLLSVEEDGPDNWLEE